MSYRKAFIVCLASLAALVLAAPVAAQVAPAPSPSASAAPASDLGGPGESCRARSDCRHGLKCVSAVCASEHEGETCGATSECGEGLKCIQQVCKSPLAVRGAASGSRGGLAGMHPFVGTAFMGGPSFAMVTYFGTTTELTSGYLWALRLGVYLDKLELAAEISPKTYWPYGSQSGLQMNGTVGYLIPISEAADVSVYWPIRGGVGFVLPDGGSASFQARGDFVGLAIKVDQVMIDLHAPSYRYNLETDSGATLHSFSWFFGGGVSYLF